MFTYTLQWSYIYFFIILIYFYEYSCFCHMYVCLVYIRPEESVRYSKTGVMDRCEGL